MDFKAFFDDTDAVSPVIGVILMVAITVILAAVIGTFVLGLGDQVQTTSPNANWDWDYDQASDATTNDTLTVSHEGGDTIDANLLTVSISGVGDEGSTTYSGSAEWGGSDTQLQAGSSFQIGGSSGDDLDAASGWGSPLAASPTDNSFDMSGAEASVIWESESGGSSSTLTDWSGPDA